MFRNGCFTGENELFEPEGAHRVEHPVPAAAVDRLDQRLVGEAGEYVDHVVDRAVEGAHLLGRGERGTAGEHGQPPGQGALLFVQQIPGPLDHRTQRAVPGHGGATASGQQPEPVAEPRRDLGHRQRP
jgi:hypothetical protein